MNTQQVMTILNCSRGTVDNLRKRGMLRAVKDNKGKWQYSELDISNILKSREVN